MRIRALLVATLATAVLLSGCSGKGSDEPGETFEGAPLDATPDTGVLRGVVFDEAITPLTGVLVTADGPGDAQAQLTTGASGTFGFDGLAPGTWFVQATKAGYVAGQETVEVVADVDEPEIIKILLTADPATTPYIQALVFEGFLECNFTLVVVRFAACSGVANDHFLQEYTLEQPPTWLQSEMVWESTQALGSEMQISITDFSTPLQTRVNASAGPSPQYISVNASTAAQFRFGVNNTVVIRVFNDAVDETDVVQEETFQAPYRDSVYPAYNGTPAPGAVQTAVDTVNGDPLGAPDIANPFSEDCVKYPALFDACLAVGGVGATVEQAFTVYTHVFYHFQPNEGWRFSSDGDHPLPA